MSMSALHRDQLGGGHLRSVLPSGSPSRRKRRRKQQQQSHLTALCRPSYQGGRSTQMDLVCTADSSVRYMALSPPPTPDPPEVLIPGRPQQTEHRWEDSRLSLCFGLTLIQADESKTRVFPSSNSRLILSFFLRPPGFRLVVGFSLPRSLFAFRDINFTHALLPARKLCQ